MNQMNFAIWIETGTGRRTLIATSACCTFAMLVGEAVWAHVRQSRATTLDVRLIEVQDGSSLGGPGIPPIIARWSASGQEQLCEASTFADGDEAEKHLALPPAMLPCDSPRATPEPQIDQAESVGLSAFFPTAQEWAPWKTWRALDQ